MQIPIGRARLGELAAVAKLERRVWKRMAASEGRLRRRFRRFPQGLLVARAADGPVGFCAAALNGRDARDTDVDEDFPAVHVPGGRFYNLFALTVDPVFRRRGIASRLVRRHLRQARRLGCGKVQLIANAYSRPLFEQSGFEVAEPLPGLFADFRDLMPEAALMELVLSGPDPRS